MLIFVAPFLSIWLLYSTYIIWRRPANRTTQLVKIVLWSLTISGVLSLHWHYQRAVREAANAAVSTVLQYKAIHGSFPKTPEAAGLKDRTWRISYFLKNGKPYLVYPATFIVFDIYSYDFERQSWTYQPD